MATPDPNLILASVFESDDPVALSVAQARLADAGVEFVVVEEALQGYGFSPMINPISRIQVAQSCEAQARELLQGLFSPLEPEGSDESASGEAEPSSSGDDPK